jgi:hypothetical protein|tara:strand:+ start:915 stop:1064 length:150 start_codon:yes stop_codon:yes gene_type:complete
MISTENPKTYWNYLEKEYQSPVGVSKINILYSSKKIIGNYEKRIFDRIS